MTHDRMEAGPEILAPTAGKKKIPVPIIELTVINNICQYVSDFFSCFIYDAIYKLYIILLLLLYDYQNNNFKNSVLFSINYGKRDGLYKGFKG